MTDVRTESGSYYEFKDDKVRRVNTSAIKRADSEWVRVVSMWPKVPTVGVGMILELESLSRLGVDDFGTPADLVGPTTVRRTTSVVEVIP